MAILTAAAFWPVLSARLINYDDADYITGNPLVTGPVSAESLASAFTQPMMHLYHPLSIVTLMIGHAVWGLDPFGYQAANLVIHFLSVVLLLIFLHYLTGELARPTLAAAIWAVHPLRAESVAWAAEQKDVLSVFFALAALIAYVRYVRRGGIARHVAIIVAAWLSMLA